MASLRPGQPQPGRRERIFPRPHLCERRNAGCFGGAGGFAAGTSARRLTPLLPSLRSVNLQLRSKTSGVNVNKASQRHRGLCLAAFALSAVAWLAPAPAAAQAPRLCGPGAPQGLVAALGGML